MYRVVREAPAPIGVSGPVQTDAKATCTQCGQWKDCAKCSGCGDTKCLDCYNGKKKLPEVAQGFNVQDDE